MTLSIWINRPRWLLFVLILYLTDSGVVSSKRSTKYFTKLVNAYRSLCYVDPTCPEAKFSLESLCCGRCTCDDQCKEHGSCCPGVHKSFTQARKSLRNTRYSCILPQLLSSKEPEYNANPPLWMSTKCEIQYLSTEHAHNCENSRGFSASALPVTDVYTKVHYKNKFCAYCNGVPKQRQLVAWKLRVVNTEFVEFPKADLYEYLKHSHGNVFFIPPLYVTKYTCDVSHEYTISTCNATGLWSKSISDFVEDWDLYVDQIETACAAFIDPFNKTYKNYFCMLCNTDAVKFFDNSTDWNCPWEWYPYHKRPRFSMIVDLHTITGRSPADAGLCSDSQFYDNIKRLCRQVHCYNEHYLEDGKCQFEASTWQRGICFSVFMKLTPFPNQNVKQPENIMDDNNYFGPVARRIKMRQSLPGMREMDFYDDEIQQTFVDFVKADSLGYVEYIIVFVTSTFTQGFYKDKFLQLITTKKATHFNEKGLVYHIKPALYNISVANGTASVLVPNLANMSVEELKSSYDVMDENLCPNGSTYLTKLHGCPYVKLHVNEYHMNFDDDRLTVIQSFEKDMAVLTLSRFEFERHNDEIYVCFDDFLKIQQKWATEYATTRSAKRKHYDTMYRQYTFVFTAVTMVILT